MMGFASPLRSGRRGFSAPARRGNSYMSHPPPAALQHTPTRHARLIAWVKNIAALTRPDRVYWCDGSDAEWERLTSELVALGTLKRLNAAKRPNSFYAAS